MTICNHCLPGMRKPFALSRSANVLFDENSVPSRSTDLVEGILNVPALIASAREGGYKGPFEFEIFARDHDGSDTEGICARAVRAFDDGRSS